MKWVSMLTVCGLFGVHSLGGMMIKKRDNSKVPTLFQQCVTMAADHITDLRSESSGLIEWGNAPDDVKHSILSQVPLNKDNFLFWLENVIYFDNQKHKLVLEDLRSNLGLYMLQRSLRHTALDMNVVPSLTKGETEKCTDNVFKEFLGIGADRLLSFNLEDLASIVIHDGKEAVNALDLSKLKTMLSISTMSERNQRDPFPASVGRYQRFFNKPLDVSCKGMRAFLATESNNLVIAYLYMIRREIPTHNDDLKRATALMFNSDGSKFVVGFKGGNVRVYGKANWEKEVTGHLLAVTAVALSPDEDIVASASINGELCLSSISAGTHVKMWVDNLVSSISFEGNGALKLTMDRVVSRPIPLGSLDITDDQIVSKSVPLQYLKGKLTNKELLVAYIVKCMNDQNETLKYTIAAKLGLFMDKNELFEPVMREYFRGIITGKDK